MALGAPQNSRKPPSGVYEPERHNMNPRSGNNASAYQKRGGQNNMNTENSVIESSPLKRRVGLPPTNRSAAANRAR